MWYFKHDKFNTAMMGLYIVSDLLGVLTKKRKQARIDAVEKDFAARKELLNDRLRLINAELQSDATVEDLSWMD